MQVLHKSLFRLSQLGQRRFSSNLLVNTNFVRETIGDKSVVLLDCSDVGAYSRAHIHGAIHLPVEAIQASPTKTGYSDTQKIKLGAATIPGQFLKNPERPTEIMKPDNFQTLARSLGIGPDSHVVLYDDRAMLFSTRVWWAFKYFGLKNVSILDGGWNSWIMDGNPVTWERSVPEASSGTFVAYPQAVRVVSTKSLLEVVENMNAAKPSHCIWDSRTAKQFSGEDDQGNLRAGHVPYAKHLEWMSCVDLNDPSRRMRPRTELQKLVESAKIDLSLPVITYCQMGVRAAHAAFVAEYLGGKAQVYDESMARWANEEKLPYEK